MSEFLRFLKIFAGVLGGLLYVLFVAGCMASGAWFIGIPLWALGMAAFLWWWDF